MCYDVDSILDKIVLAFSKIKGIEAIVLGGSRATNTASEHSDIDIGIYYNEMTFDIEVFKIRARTIHDEHTESVITNIGEWGMWINGGGWLKINGISVDILFRNTQKVIQVMDDCIKGNITIDYQCGHPFGFVNSIYMGEVAYCKVLYYDGDFIYQQKSKIRTFPEKYKEAIIKKFLWECEFSLLCGRKGINKEDIIYVIGSLFRCIMSLQQVLYAFNEMYMLNEKGSLKRLENEKNVYIPEHFVEEMELLIAHVDKHSMETAFEKINYYRDIITVKCIKYGTSL